MSGSAIAQLNSGLQQFITELKADEMAAYSVDLAVLTAGDRVEQALPFTTAMNLQGCAPFSASGPTPLGEAVTRGLMMLEQRKAEYRQNGVAYYQPWLVVISDGSPTDAWRDAAQRARSLADQRKLVSLMVGVNDADMYTLSQFSSRPPVKLDGLKFAEFFQWLSASMSRVSASASTTAGVSLPAIDGWASI